ncbi:hypothetical protein [Cypionkella sp.]|uniref:hypothetical protein n=1 Tax=Cypionkella sp. TaxID=2811411 RepID=UPI002615DEE3|nr:hypothetical protein [Cypionkella sp.]
MSYLTRQPVEALAGIALFSPLTHFSMAGLRLNVLLQKIATWGASALPLRNQDAAVLLWRLQALDHSATRFLTGLPNLRAWAIACQPRSSLA